MASVTFPYRDLEAALALVAQPALHRVAVRDREVRQARLAERELESVISAMRRVLEMASGVSLNRRAISAVLLR